MTPISAIATKKEKGFTLIELVMVIVILGILAAFALPRFADLGGEARAASISGAQGAVRSASAIVRSQALASNVVNGNVTLEGTAIPVVNGYASAAGIVAAAQLSNEYTVAPDPIADPVTISLGDCSFTYTQAAAANGSATISDVADGNNDGEC